MPPSWRLPVWPASTSFCHSASVCAVWCKAFTVPLYQSFQSTKVPFAQKSSVQVLSRKGKPLYSSYGIHSPIAAGSRSSSGRSARARVRSGQTLNWHSPPSQSLSDTPHTHSSAPGQQEKSGSVRELPSGMSDGQQRSQDLHPAPLIHVPSVARTVAAAAARSATKKVHEYRGIADIRSCT